jgi:hypothetical protein
LIRKTIPAAKVIGFPRAIGSGLLRYVEEVPVDAVGTIAASNPKRRTGCNVTSAAGQSSTSTA